MHGVRARLETGGVSCSKHLFWIGVRLFRFPARLLVETEPLPSGRPPFQAVDPERSMVPCSYRAVLGSSGLLSRGFEDQPRDFVGMGDQREMAGLHLDGLCTHPLGHEALKVRIDRAVFR